MITNRDRPIRAVEDSLVETLGRDESGRSLRRRTGNDAIIPGTTTTLEDIIIDDETGRKERLVKTLDGDPNKGTVVIACRGTADATDLMTDMATFTNTKVNTLKTSALYVEIKDRVQEILRTLFSPVESTSNRSYQKYWDVFATGHSLGGAITDQLILDGVVKGGLSFSAPRTVSSKRTMPSYGIINKKDGIVGSAFGQWDQPYDLVVPGVSYFEANPITQHNMSPYMDPERTAVRLDSYPRYNDGIFKPSLFGSGRAPQNHTLFKAAKNAYDNGDETYRQNVDDFVQQGLLLPELTMYRNLSMTVYPVRKAIVHFYVFSTPKFDYLEMPIRPQIETALRNVARGQELDDAKLAMLMNNF